MNENVPKWIPLYLSKGWYQQYLPYSNPDCTYHYIYQRRVNRWCGLIISLILAYAAYDLIDWSEHGKTIALYVAYMFFGGVIGILAFYVIGACLSWLYDWLSGR